MNRTISLFIFLFALNFILNAQNNWVFNNDVKSSHIVTQNDDIYDSGTFYGNVDFDLSDTTEYFLQGGTFSNRSCFLRKLDGNGNFLWAKSWTGENSVTPLKIKSHSTGIYILGSFEGNLDFDPGSDTLSVVSTEGFIRQSAFLMKLDLEGDLLWVQKWNTVSNNWSYNGESFDIDIYGNAYIVDEFVNQWEFCGVPFNGSSAHLYLGKISAAGEYLWFKDLSPIGNFETPEIVYDGQEHLYISAQFEGGYTLETPNEDIVVPNIGLNFDRTAIIKVDIEGNPVWGNAFESDKLNSIHFSNDRIYLIGSFTGLTDLDPDLNVDLLVEPTLTSFNFFILQVDTTGDLIWLNTKFGNGSSSAFGTQVVISGSDTSIEGDLIITGYFDGDTDFMPGDSVVIFETNDDFDRGFLMRMSVDDGNLKIFEHLDDPSTNFGTIQTWEIYIDEINRFYLSGFTGIDPFQFQIDDQTYAPLEYNNASSGEFLVKHQLCLPTNDTITLNQICSEQIINGVSYSEEGTYEQVLINEAGCDSILNIIILHPQLMGNLLVDDSCEEQIINGEIFSEPGNYTQHLINQNGCDSILTIEIIHPTFEDSILLNENCEDQEINGITYTEEGVYTQSLISSQGCDSLLTIEVIYPVLNDTIFLVGQTLFVTPNFQEYQWLDCTTNTIIFDQNENAFSPLISGSYAAIITNGNCSIETDCIEFISTGLKESYPNGSIQIFPTIFEQIITIALSEKINFEENKISVFNLQGQIIEFALESISLSNTAQIIFPKNLPSGMYFLHFHSKKYSYTKQIIKLGS